MANGTLLFLRYGVLRVDINEPDNRLADRPFDPGTERFTAGDRFVITVECDAGLGDVFVAVAARQRDGSWQVLEPAVGAGAVTNAVAGAAGLRAATEAGIGGPAERPPRVPTVLPVSGLGENRTFRCDPPPAVDGRGVAVNWTDQIALVAARDPSFIAELVGRPGPAGAAGKPRETIDSLRARRDRAANKRDAAAALVAAVAGGTIPLDGADGAQLQIIGGEPAATADVIVVGRQWLVVDLHLECDAKEKEAR